MRTRTTLLLLALMAFFTPSLFLPAAAAADEAKRLRILFVVDTNADTIGPMTRISFGGLRDVIGQVKKQQEDRFTWDLLEGRRVTPTEVLGYYRNLKVEPDDALFFFYTGHGGWDARTGQGGNEKGHFLAMSGGNLYRSDLRRAMLDKHPHAMFLFTDSCSNVVSVDMERPRAPAAAEWEVFRDLFFRPRGVVDVQAATRGQFCWYNPQVGGYFTVVLAQLLGSPRRTLRAEDRDGPLSWGDFSSRLKSETEKLFQQARQRAGPTEGIKKAKAQTPEVFYLTEWPENERYLRIVNHTGEPLRVWVRVYTSRAGDGWAWEGNTNDYFDFAPGESSYLKTGDWTVRGHKIRFYARTPTGRTWGSYWQRDHYLVPRDGYRAAIAEQRTYTLRFP